MIWREDAVRDSNRLVGKLETRQNTMEIHLEAEEKETQLIRQRYRDAAYKLELGTTPKCYIALFYMAL